MKNSLKFLNNLVKTLLLETICLKSLNKIRLYSSETRQVAWFFNKKDKCGTHKKRNNLAEIFRLLNWVVGFVDGAGYFYQIAGCKSLKVAFAFRVSQKGSFTTLYNIQKILGIGYIKGPDNKAMYHLWIKNNQHHQQTQQLNLKV